MKKYFAKYLPVEGEIKEGDMVKTMGEPMQPFKKGMNERAYQLYKLFLCSRDIQVGGEFYNSEDLIKRFNYNPDTIDMLGGWNFRVIGEISPEATWVKEGDEFDEEEIELWTGFGHFRKIERNNPDYYLHAKEKGSIFKILGPCKRFH